MYQNEINKIRTMSARFLYDEFEQITINVRAGMAEFSAHWLI